MKLTLLLLALIAACHATPIYTMPTPTAPITNYYSWIDSYHYQQRDGLYTSPVQDVAGNGYREAYNEEHRVELPEEDHWGPNDGGAPVRVTPEPSMLSPLAIGLTSLWALRRRK